MYFFSDLDKTLIYSGYPEHKCVEWKDSKEITYMTERSYDLMQNILQKVIFIPTTMRSLEQTLRIEWIKKYNPQFIICYNGYEIYINGEKDTKWGNFVKEKISSELVLEYNNKAKFCNMNIVEAKNFGGYYFVWKFNDIPTEKEIKKAKEFIPYDFHLQVDGKKMFFLPNSINKAKAVDYLVQKYKLKNNIYIAGDSSADKEMLELPYAKAFIPKHSKLKLNRKDVFVSENEYIYATENIIKKILLDIG